MLVLGAHGMLGQALMHRFREHLAGKGCDAPVGWDIAELDIRNREAVSSALRRLRPAVVVNAAAYTDVDGCESESELAFAVNADGAGHIACACAAIGATMLHLSTDFIFDGHIERPYLPDEPPNQLSVYGRTKWAGEQNVRNS
ncbi:MAG: SDR family oxidoreductase, partial [Phycisphaerae bacterium]